MFILSTIYERIGNTLRRPSFFLHSVLSIVEASKIIRHVLGLSSLNLEHKSIIGWTIYMQYFNTTILPLNVLPVSARRGYFKYEI